MFNKRLLIIFGLVMTMVLSFSLFANADEEVEVFSWWTGGGEEEGLQALIEVFEEEYPDIEFINATVAGGAGTNAKQVLQTRMIGEDPPDSFQVHGGAELIDTYVKTGMMEPVNDLLDEWGITDKFNKQILEMSSYEDEYYSIPLTVHRSNIVFYNKEIIDKYDIEEPEDLDGFIEVLEELDEADEDIAPLALGDKQKWEATHLFEGVLLAALGPEKYNGLWDGSTSFEDPGVGEAIEKYNEIVQYVNKDHASLTWQDATQLVNEGDAAFIVMGDWAEGYLKQLDWEPAEDFGWMPVPGSQESFMVITDTFGLPKGAPNPEAAKSFLRLVASKKGQDTFNPIKGSIPARTDADKDLYDAYLTSSMEDFAEDTLTPSIAHGSAAPEGFLNELNDIINELVSEGDTEKAWDDIVQAADEYL
ncbi:MAG: ABC transporter substrate-binding protein [Halanaerobiaceae bacterium]